MNETNIIKTMLEGLRIIARRKVSALTEIVNHSAEVNLMQMRTRLLLCLPFGVSTKPSSRNDVKGDVARDMHSNQMLKNDSNNASMHLGLFASPSHLSLFPFYFSLHAFSIAEVLLTLGIISVVAAMTIPTLMNNIQDNQYKVAYKKAYSILTQAFTSAKSQELLINTDATNGNNLNVLAIMNQLKTTKKCTNYNNSSCWNSNGEQFGRTYAPIDGRPSTELYSFIDASGMAWTVIEVQQGRIAVDTNGFKKPNQWGKDRFVFHLYSGETKASFSEISGIPTTVWPYSDNHSQVCTGNACGTSSNKDFNTYYGTSWLYN